MITGIPLYLTLIFAATTLLTIAFLFRASHRSKKTLLLLLGWIALQSGISFNGFYLYEMSLPPRFALLIGPPLLFILILFTTKKGRVFIDGLDARSLTLLHVVRVPVEIVLLGLYLNGLVPELMTFEGRNFDIVSGLTAPIMAWWGFRKGIKKTALLVWNFICLGLLFNIVIHAILSAPSPFQQLAFDQPNIGVFLFPFVWLHSTFGFVLAPGLPSPAFEKIKQLKSPIFNFFNDVLQPLAIHTCYPDVGIAKQIK